MITILPECTLSAKELSKKLGVSQPSVSISVKRGEKIAKTEQLELGEEQKVIIRMSPYCSLLLYERFTALCDQED